MNLSKKQEKAIDIACRVMSAALSSGIDSDEDGSISEAIEELSLLKNKCFKSKRTMLKRNIIISRRNCTCIW